MSIECRADVAGYQAPKNWFEDEIEIVNHFETKFYEQFDNRENDTARALANEALTDATPVTRIMENFIMDIAASEKTPEVPANLIPEIKKYLELMAERNGDSL